MNNEASRDQVTLIESRVEQQMLDLVLRQNPMAQLVSLVLGLVAAWILSSHAVPMHLLAWFSVLAAFSLYRLWVIRHHGRAPVPHDAIATVRWRFSAGLLLTGLTWASLPWVVNSPDALPTYFTAMLLVGLVAGAVAAVSMRRSFFLLFTVPMMASMLLFLLVRPVTSGLPAAFVLAVFYVGLLRAADIVGSEVRRYLRLKMRSEEARREAEDSAVLLAETNDELMQRRRLMENLLDIATRPDCNLDERLDELLLFGSEILGLRLAIISRVRGDDYQVMHVVDRRAGEKPIEVGEHRALGETVCTHTVRGNSLFLYNSPDEARNTLHPAYWGVTPSAYIGAPIDTADGRYGTLNFSDAKEREPFSAAEIEFIRLVASWIGGAISEQQAVRQLRSKERQLSNLTDAMPCGMASISNDLRYRYVNRVFQATFNPDGEPLVGRYLKNTHTLGGFTLVQNQFRRALRGKTVEFEYQPPVAKDEIPSVYRVNLVPNTNEEGEQDGCFVLVNDITDDRLLQSELERKASLDPLTLAFNRKFLDETLERIVNDRRRKRPLYLALVDLDHFKQVNDSAGHEAGDLVLKKVATDLKAEMRRGDILARYGGDEFVLLLHCVDEDDLRLTCDKLLRTVADERFEYGGRHFPITLSIGATRVVYGEPVKQLLKRADRALYAAKHRGKGRLEIAAPELVDALRRR
ncbi:MAG: diguanylate cyclase [Gammaproteobacteria bacterium]|nr:diguanylate cyclase [Gammaproteobacteria bacterium]